MQWRLGETGTGVLLAAFACPVYLLTLSPSVATMDAGELAAAAHTLGVAHPTGYPLYLLLAKAFSLLPLPGMGVLVKLNLMNALLGALAVFLFHRLFTRLLTGFGSGPVRLAAAGGTMTLAFSRTFWAQATSAEVYALHLVFLASLLLLFLPPAAPGARAARLPLPEGRRWLLFAYALGLSFANHMMTVLLAPALLYAYFSGRGLESAAWKDIARAAPPFLLGLSAYAYLPIRAAARPVMNWGEPSAWGGFYRHVTGAQFREWMFSSPGAALHGLARFVAGIPLEFAWLPLVLAAVGIAGLRVGSSFGFRFTLLLFGACVLYAVNYAIPDPDAYFLLAHVVIALWSAFGLRALLERAPAGRGAWYAAGGLVALAVLPLAANFAFSDQRGRHAREDFARNLLGGLEPGALLLSDAESEFYFTAAWLQFVEGYRRDVTVVGYRALAFPWHLGELEARHPGFLGAVHAEVEAYRRERGRFEGGGGDSAALAGRFVAMTRGLLRAHFAERPLYVTPDVDPALFAPWRAAPDGLALRVFAGDSLPVAVSREFSYRALEARDPAAPPIRAAYAAAYCYQGVYQALRGDTAAALGLLRKSLEVDPAYADARAWTARLSPPR